MRQRRAFTLTEILLAIGLLGVFMLLASRLITANFHIAAATLTETSNSARFDQATRLLRADVSNSVAVEMPQSTLLQVHTLAEQTVNWKVGQTTISRVDLKGAHTWEVGQQLHLTLDGVVVLLSANTPDQIAMASMPKGALR